MMFRLFFAITCSLFLLGLIPYLNRSRTASELAVISYRLNSFETKLTPPIESIPEPEIIREKAKSVEVTMDIPRPLLTPLSVPVSAQINTGIQFSASALPAIYAKGSGNTVSNDIPKTSLVQNFTFQQDGGDHLLYGPKPITPLRARQLGLTGNVTVQWDVDEKGLVENVTVIKSSNEIFNKPVIVAVKQYRFKPYLDQNGKLVKVTLTKEFEFEVQ